MSQIADTHTYEGNDGCGYFRVDVPDFNKGREQSQTQTEGDPIGRRKPKELSDYGLAFCVGLEGNVFMADIGVDDCQDLSQHHGSHICYGSR